MSEAPQAAPVAAPVAPDAAPTLVVPPTKASLAVDIVQGVKELIPPSALAGALIVMLFTSVPAANHDPVTIVISGFLGYLTGRNASKSTPAPQTGA